MVTRQICHRRARTCSSVCHSHPFRCIWLLDGDAVEKDLLHNNGDDAHQDESPPGRWNRQRPGATMTHDTGVVLDECALGLMCVQEHAEQGVCLSSRGTCFQAPWATNEWNLQVHPYWRRLV